MEYKRLGDICEIVSGGTPKTTISEFWNGDYDWITQAELNADSYIVNSSCRKVTKLGIEKSGLNSFPVGTVMLSSRAPIGKVAIAGKEMYCNQGFKNFICNDELINKYLFWFLKGKTEYLNSLGRGATFKELSKDIIGNVKIPLPDKNMQMQIVKKLEKIKKMIMLRNQQINLLDELVRARFVEMFGDMLLNSMEWPEVKLEILADVVSGITKGRKIRESNLIEVPYMAVSNVKEGYIDWTKVKTIMATEQEIEQYRLRSKDVLMTEGGDPDKLGRGAIIEEPLENCIHQNHIFRVRLNRAVVIPEFFEEYLQHQKAKRYFIACAKQTTGIASINMKQLRALPVMIPPIELQNQFADFVTEVDKSRLQIQKSLEKTQELYDSLMQKYFG